VPLNEDCWLGINLPASNPNIGAPYRQAIVAFVQALNDAGLYVILDLHWNAPGTSIANQQQPMADLDHAPAFWSSVAATFKNFPAVIFDLYNEPYVSTWDCWQNGCSVTTSDGTWSTAGMTQLVAAVRSVGATQPIMLGGLQYASDLSQWLAHKPVDPISGPAQLVASYHSYCGPPGTSTVAACQSALNSLRSQEWPVVASVASSVPVVTGEFGEYDCATTYVSPYMAFADANGISYLGWAWDTYGCGSFPALVADYTGTPTAYGIGLKSHLAALRSMHGTHDLNGDAVSDVLWRNVNSGGVATWLMNGATIMSALGVGSVPSSWQIVGQRDFNGDGMSDILWRSSSGGVALWFMSSGTVLSAVGVGSLPNAWGVVGTGDFNGDGISDILWHDTSGNVALWFMNSNGTMQSAVGLGNVPTNWVIAGTGDFNGDGIRDILWRETTMGGTALWLMNSNDTIMSAVGVGSVSTDWTIAGTGDFNGDGKADILWSNTTSGGVAVWLMNGGTITSSSGIGSLPPGWTIAETGDFNGDGMSDVLLYANNGGVAVWIMNGAAVTSAAGVGSLPTDWQIQSANAD
jgi:Cellulase (glycosyl hydrolase family 5)/FG-GAP-like repeat